MDLKSRALAAGIPIAKDDTLDLLKSLIIDKGYHDILELGTAIGYSAICMAKIDQCIHIDTIERDTDRYRQAIVNIEEAGLSDQITVYNTEVLDFRLWHGYDLIFVDAAKAHYKEYYDWAFDYLAPWGTMVFDNMAFHGLVADISKTDKRRTRRLVRKLDGFIAYVQGDERSAIMLVDDIGDGVLLVRRKET